MGSTREIVQKFRGWKEKIEALVALIRKVQIWRRRQYNRIAGTHRDPSTCQAWTKIFTNMIYLNLHSVSKGSFHPGFIDEAMELREDEVSRSYD